eukprot:4153494-Karenia_brevis.AAC.1
MAKCHRQEPSWQSTQGPYAQGKEQGQGMTIISAHSVEHLAMMRYTCFIFAQNIGPVDTP